MWSSIKNALFNYPLHDAIKNNDQERVIQLINSGASIKAKNWRWQTPLHLATAANQPALIRLLVDNGAKVDARDIFGSSSLHYAVKYNHQAALLALTQKGANLNLQSPSAKFRNNLNYYATLPTQAVNLVIKLASIYVLFLSITYASDFFIGLNSMSALAQVVGLVGNTLDANLMSLLSFIETSRLAPYIYSTAQATVEFIRPHLVQSITTLLFLGLKKAKERYSNTINNIVSLSWKLGILSWIFLPTSLSYIKPLLWAPWVLNRAILMSDFVGSIIVFPLNAVLGGTQILFSWINTRVANYCLSISDNFGGTPLHIAARLNHIESTHHLIEHGADLGALDLNNKTALEIALANHNHGTCVQLIREGKKLDAVTPQMANPILPTDDNVRHKLNRRLEKYCDKETATLLLLSEAKSDAPVLENMPQNIPLLFSQLNAANPDVGRKIMSMMGKFGDNEENSLKRINELLKPSPTL